MLLHISSVKVVAITKFQISLTLNDLDTESNLVYHKAILVKLHFRSTSHALTGIQSSPLLNESKKMHYVILHR